MGIKTHFTLEYLNNYLKQNNIIVPKEANLASIFKECDKYDENEKEVKNGDGILQTKEIREFLNKLDAFGSNFRFSVFKCVEEVWNKQKKEALETEQEKLNNPPKAYDSDGSLGSDEAFDYIYAKLETLGVNLDDIDFDVLSDIMSRYDYELDADKNSTISKKEADSFYDSNIANKYMNKNSKGQTVDTHLLDWIINNYLAKTKADTSI